jgi:NADH/NAD ratio-sensing transcriptional regulator Rex
MRTIFVLESLKHLEVTRDEACEMARNKKLKITAEHYQRNKEYFSKYHKKYNGYNLLPICCLKCRRFTSQHNIKNHLKTKLCSSISSFFRRN